MGPTSFREERVGNGSEISAAAVGLEQATAVRRNDRAFDKEDVVLVLILLASVAICLLTVVGVVLS